MISVPFPTGSFTDVDCMSRFVMACRATTPYPDRWLDVMRFTNDGKISTPSVARSLWRDMVSTMGSSAAAPSRALREEIQGDVLIYPGETCPWCFKAPSDNHAQSRVLESRADASLAPKPVFGRESVAYRASGSVFRPRVYVRKCTRCDAMAFPTHVEPVPGRKHGLPEMLDDCEFVSFTYETYVSKSLVARFMSHLAVSAPIPMEQYSVVYAMGQESSMKVRGEGAAPTFCVEGVPTVLLDGQRAVLPPKVFSEAVQMTFMLKFIRRSRSLMKTFSWGPEGLSFRDRWRAAQSAIFLSLRENFLAHCAEGRARREDDGDKKTVCGVAVVFDGYCQLVRSHCDAELSTETTHPYQRHTKKCSNSVARLPGGKWSCFCEEHAAGGGGGARRAEARDDNLAGGGDGDEDVEDDRGANASGTSSAAVAAIFNRGRRAQLEKAEAARRGVHGQMERIIWQVSDGDEGQRRFLVKWKDDLVIESTVETERIIPVGLINDFFEKHGAAPTVYDVVTDRAGNLQTEKMAFEQLTKLYKPKDDDPNLRALDEGMLEKASKVSCASKDFDRGRYVAGMKASLRPTKARAKRAMGSASADARASKVAKSSGTNPRASSTEAKNTRSGAGDSEDERSDLPVGHSQAFETPTATPLGGSVSESPQIATAADAAGGSAEGAKAGDAATCRPCPKTSNTTGTLWAICSCGYPAPPVEMIQSESHTMLAEYMQRLYDAETPLPPFMIYDDMCHFVQYTHNRKALSPFFRRLHEEVTMVVDKFHFKTHTGSFCIKYCNPSRYPELDGCNGSVCEAEFRMKGRFKHLMRGCREETFNLMLMMIADSRQQFFSRGGNHVGQTTSVTGETRD